MLRNENEKASTSAWPSVLLLVAGALIILYAVVSMRNEIPAFLWGPAWVVGPLFVLIGGGALVRGRGSRS